MFLLNIKLLKVCVLVFEPLILFHWPSCLFLYQSHIVYYVSSGIDDKIGNGNPSSFELFAEDGFGYMGGPV